MSLVVVSGLEHFPAQLRPAIDELLGQAGWQNSATTMPARGQTHLRLLCLDGSECALAIARAAATEADGWPRATMVVVVGEAAVAQAATQSWPNWWAWLPWPLPAGWLTLSLKLAVDQAQWLSATSEGGSGVTPDPLVGPGHGHAQELLGTALSASGLLDFEYDLANGVRRARPRDLQVIGYSPHDFAEALSMIHPDDRARMVEAFDLCRSTGCSYHLEYRANLSGHGYRWYRAEGSVLCRNAQHPGRLIGVAWDVHEEREAKDQARDAKRRLDQALAAAGMLSWEWSHPEPGRRVIGNGLGLPEAGDGSPLLLESLIQDEDRAVDSERLYAAIAAGKRYQSEVRIDVPGLGRRWLQLSGYPRRSIAGLVVSMSGLALDVTARRAMDEDLADTRTLLHDSLEAGRMYCWEWNLGDGSRRTIGPSQDIFGVVPTTVRDVMALMHPDDLAADRELLQRTLREGVPYQNEFRIIRPDGDIRWIFARGNVIHGSDGKPVRLTGVAVDVSERRRAEERLAEASQRLEIALDAAKLSPWSIELNSDLLIGGAEAVESSPEAQYLALVIPRDRDSLRRLRDPVFLASGESLRIEYRIRRRDGAERWLACHARAVHDAQGRPVQLVGVTQDISEEKHAQEKLARSLTQLDRVQSATRVVLWEWERSTGARCLQTGGEELSGQELPQIHPVDRRRVFRRLLVCARSNGVFDEEFRVRDSTGAYSWVAVQGARSAFDPERGATLSGVMLDITARRQVAEQLALAQERLRRALGAAKMVCWDWKAHEPIGGGSDYTPQVANVGGPLPAGSVHPLDRERHQAAIADALSGRTPDYRCEFRVRRSDESVIWLLSIGSRLLDSEGRVVGLTGVAIDITAQKGMEGELAESREWQRMAMEAGELNVWRVDVATGRRHGGALDERVFGFVPRHVSEVEALIHPGDRERVDQAWSRSVELGAPYQLDYRLVLDSGVRWLRVRGKRLLDRNSGEPLMVGVTLDITEQIHAEVDLRNALRQARAASDAKSAFLASVSHELRTPLNAVIGFSALLQALPMDSTQQAHLIALSSGANQLYALINDVLDYSRIEAGEMTLEQTPFSLHDCLEPALDMVAGVAEGKGLALALTSRGDCHRMVVGDPTRLRQVAVNLLANATKFTERGAVAIEIEAAEVDEQMALTLRVRDSGIGMDTAVVGKLFQPFCQGDVSTTRRFGGTGLGLSICKRLVALMNGSISVDSEPGRGSCFEVRLNLAYADDARTPAPSLAGRVVGLAASTPALRAALRTQCREFGASVRDIDADRLADSLRVGTAPLELLVLEQPQLDALLSLFRGPRRPDGQLLPVVVLAPMDWSKQPWTGQHGERYLPLARALKPRLLFAALASALGEVEPAAAIGACPAAARAAAPVYRDALANLRVLAAEDVEVNQLLMQAQLESLGVSATLVGGGQQALDALAAEPFDVVLMDVEMPGMDGLEAARRIRGDARFQQRPPYIVAVTAHVLGDSRSRFLASGMDDFVSKPVMLDSLRAALERGLAARAARSEPAHPTAAPVAASR
jgi:PAS domain S-box-containing protein